MSKSNIKSKSHGTNYQHKIQWLVTAEKVVKLINCESYSQTRYIREAPGGKKSTSDLIMWLTETMTPPAYTRFRRDFCVAPLKHWKATERFYYTQDCSVCSAILKPTKHISCNHSAFRTGTKGHGDMRRLLFISILCSLSCTWSVTTRNQFICVTWLCFH